MRVRNEVFAAKCSDRWIGLRSPVSWAKPTTSDDATVLRSRSLIPTERSSKNSVRSGGNLTGAFDLAPPPLASWTSDPGFAKERFWQARPEHSHG